MQPGLHWQRRSRCCWALSFGRIALRANQAQSRWLPWAGAAYAVYGIFALLVEPTSVLWREKV